MSEPIKVSNSEMRTFKTCRRQWWLQYYRELARPPQPGEVGALPLGTKVHLALERMYTEGTDPLESLAELYEAELGRLADVPFGDELAVGLRKEWDLAKAMIEGFLEWREEEAIDAGLELVAVEEVIEVPHPHLEGVVLRGKVDQRWRRTVDGRLVFRDWKTTQSVKESRQLLVMDEQMKFYHLLEWLQALWLGLDTADARMTDGALYTMLRKVKRTAAAKPPFYAQEEVRHNKRELETMLERVTGVILDMLRVREQLDLGADHHQVAYPNPTRDCAWRCQFFSVCPLFDDGSDVERALADQYVRQNPHERYEKEEAEE